VTATAAATPTTPVPTWPLTIAAVGDLMFDRAVRQWVTAEDPSGPFRFVRDHLLPAGLTVGNLECALTDRGAPEPKAYTFRGSPLAARGLAQAGFDAVSLANNHILDYGEEGLFDTMRALRDAGIAFAGAGRNRDEAYRHVIVERQGIRVAVLSFADVPVEGTGYDVEQWTAGPGTPGMAWIDGDMAPAIARARDEADVVIAMLHFGFEGWSEPSERQRAQAREAVAAGATLVIGHHPHVLQPVERYGGGLIAYSLGNFVFDGFEGVANDSAILRITLGTGGVVEDWELVPVQVDEWDGLPRPV
jgi:poly-gamma-glutamate synthesis protein (capsule biosynthesis protein)